MHTNQIWLFLMPFWEEERRGKNFSSLSAPLPSASPFFSVFLSEATCKILHNYPPGGKRGGWLVQLGRKRRRGYFC